MSMKVKRRRVNWFIVLSKLDNDEYQKYFFSLFKTIRRGKYLSANRAAYYTLKHFYSTTTIADLCHVLGI